jgi:signal transduction histidine kinase
MRKIILVIFLIMTIRSYGQVSAVDSLLDLLPESRDQERVELLHRIVRATWTTDPEFAIPYGKEAIALSGQLNDARLLSISYRIHGGLYNYLGKIDSGRYYKSVALNIALEENDPSLIAPTYNNLGVTSQTLGNYIEALGYFYNAYIIARQIEGFESLPIILANISEVYYDLAVYDSALLYAEKAISHPQVQSNNTRYLFPRICHARANLAKGNYEGAETDFLSIIAIGEQVNNKRYTAYALQGLGRLNHRLGDLEKAEEYIRNSRELFYELNDQVSIAETYYDLGSIQLKSDIDAAYINIHKSLEIAKRLSLVDIVLLNYENLIELYRISNNLDSLMYYHKLYNQLEVSSKQKSTQHSIEGLYSKIQEEATKTLLSEQTIELERQSTQSRYLIAIIALSIGFIGVVLYYFQKLRRFNQRLSDSNKQISKKNALIQDKNAALEELNREKNELIKIVAHDLQNPLANMVGAANLIEYKPDDEDTRTFVDIIITSGQRLSEMITKILNIEQIESKSKVIDLVPVNASEMLAFLIKDFGNQASNKNITLHQELPDGVIVNGDYTHLQQAVENILSNAIKFSPFDKSISVNLTVKGSRATIEIKDEGPGISDEDQSKLFKMFQRLSAAPTGGETSTGLGTAIAKKYVEAMQGRIWCESELGKGTSFFIELNTVS